jgi:small subunit ribosomal protein S9
MVEETEKVVKKSVFKKETTKKSNSIRKLVLNKDKERIAEKTKEKNASTSDNVDDKKESVKVEEISANQVRIVKTKIQKKSGPDKLNRTYATGKRKNAIAKVWLKKGSGKIIVNGKNISEYLQRPILEVEVNVPFVVTGTEDKYDVICTAIGGGLSGQAGAIKHGITKALLEYNTEAYRKLLKDAGLLTRDSRVVERKKPGLKKARKGQVFSKR